LGKTEIDLQVEEFNAYIKVQERHLEIAKALETLKATEAYKLVFDQIFIKEQSESLLEQLVNPNISLVDREDKDDVMRKLDLIRLFNVYFGTGGFIESNGARAKEDIDNKDVILEEMREA